MRTLDCYGDSIVNGFGVKKSFLDYSLPCKTNKYGINGLETDGLLINMSNINHKHDIFFMAGINDFSNGKSVIYVYENYLKIVKKTEGIENIFLGIPFSVINYDAWSYYNELTYKSTINKLREFEKIILDTKFAENINIINFYRKFILKENLTFDGIHPNTEGHKVLYKIFKNEIEEVYGKIWIINI